MAWRHLSPISGHPILADINCDMGAPSPSTHAAKLAVAADFDGDGLSELVVAPTASGTGGNDLWAMKFNPAMRRWEHMSPITGHPFLADINCDQRTRPVAFGVRAIVAADADGDGRAELVVVPDLSHTGGNDVWVMKFSRFTHNWVHLSPISAHPFGADLNCDEGAGTPTAFGIKFIVAGDFDGDGREELVLAPELGGTAGNDLWAMKFDPLTRQWSHMSPIAGHGFLADINCDGTAASPSSIAAKSAVVGDFDGDGRFELVVLPEVTGTGGNDLWAMKFDRATSTWQHMSQLPGHPFAADINCDRGATSPTTFGVKFALAGDLDGDGVDELVVAPDLGGTRGNDLWIMKFNPATQSWEHMSPIGGHPFLADINCDQGASAPISFGIKFALAADFDGDGVDELVVAPDLGGTPGNDLWAMKFNPATRRWEHMSPIAGHPFLADINCDEGATPTTFGLKFVLAGDFAGDDRVVLVAAPDVGGTAGNDLWAMQFAGERATLAAGSGACASGAPTALSPEEWRNWQRTVRRDVAAAHPDTPRAVVDAVLQADAQRLKPGIEGSGWSYTDCAMANDTTLLLRTDALNNRDGTGRPQAIRDVVPMVLRHALRPRRAAFVHVAAGIKVHELNCLLDGLGLALPTLGGSRGQSVAGAFSTSTHGGDIELPPIADAVRALHVVGAGGQEWWIEPRNRRLTQAGALDTLRARGVLCHALRVVYDDDLFDATLVAVGAAGVIVGVVIEAPAAFRLRSTTDTRTWGEARNLIAGIGSVARPRFLEIIINPNTRQCQVTAREETRALRSPKPAAPDLVHPLMHAVLNTTGPFALPEFTNALGTYIAEKSVETGALILGFPWTAGEYERLTNNLRFVVEAHEILIELMQFAFDPHNSQRVADLAPTAVNILWRLRFVLGTGAGLLSTVQDGYVTRLRPNGTYVDKSFKISTDQPDCAGDTSQDHDPVERLVQSHEFAVPLERALSFTDRLIEAAAAFRNDERAMLATIQLRVTRASRALIAMQQFERTVHVEVFTFRGMNGNEAFHRRMNEIAREFNAVPHWGQLHENLDRVPALLGERLERWRNAITFLSDTAPWVHVSPIAGHSFFADINCDAGAAVPSLVSAKFAVAGDFDGDGRDELIVAPNVTGTAGNDLWAMRFIAEESRWEHVSPNPSHPFLADINCDEGASGPTTFGVKFAVAGDFNGDGRAELVVAPDLGGTAGNDLWAMKYNPDARRWEHMSPIAGHPFLADINCDDGAAPTEFGIKFAVAGDFDGDGRDELIVAPERTNTAGNDLWAMKYSPGARRWEHMSPIAGHPFLADINCDAGGTPTGFGVQFMVAADFDGDGRDELVVAPDQAGTAGNDLWAMKYNPGARRWEHMSPIAGHAFLADINCDEDVARPATFGVRLGIAGDFDGDGQAELIVAPDRTGTASNDLWAVKFNRSVGRWEHMSPIAAHPFHADINPDAAAREAAASTVKLLVAGDYDGDRRDELVIALRTGNDLWAIKFDPGSRTWNHTNPIPNHPHTADISCDSGVLGASAGPRFALFGRFEEGERSVLVVGPTRTGTAGNDLWALRYPEKALFWSAFVRARRMA